MPPTILLSSAYMESGEFFPFIKSKLIRLSAASAVAARPPDYKFAPLDAVEDAAKRLRPIFKRECPRTNRLRPLTLDEAGLFDRRRVELAPHSHTHRILKNERRDRRDQEILTSIRKVAVWTGQPVRLFPIRTASVEISTRAQAPITGRRH
jgi:hypothetical protein